MLDRGPSTLLKARARARELGAFSTCTRELTQGPDVDRALGRARDALQETMRNKIQALAVPPEVVGSGP